MPPFSHVGKPFEACGAPRLCVFIYFVTLVLRYIGRNKMSECADLERDPSAIKSTTVPLGTLVWAKLDPWPWWPGTFSFFFLIIFTDNKR